MVPLANSCRYEPYPEKFLKGFRPVDKRMLATLAATTRLTGADFRVLAVAQLEERNPGEEFALSISIIIRRTGLPRRTVQRALQRLRQSGIMRLMGRGKANRYVIVPDALSAARDIAEQYPSVIRGESGVSNDATEEFVDDSAGTSNVRRNGALGSVNHDALLNNNNEYLNTCCRVGSGEAAARKQTIRRLLAAYAEVKSADLDTTIPRAMAIIDRQLNEWDEAQLLLAIEAYRDACRSENREPRYRMGAANFFEKVESYIAATTASLGCDGSPLTPEQVAILEAPGRKEDPDWLDKYAAQSEVMP